jgi:hypothetical protein
MKVTVLQSLGRIESLMFGRKAKRKKIFGDFVGRKE